jgi:predicted DCC family thiol-disulfide oxidoreductase YuxK
MIKPYKPDESDYPFHFWLMQFLCFAYVLYRLASRDYSVYGFLPEEYFIYPRYPTNIYPSQLGIEIINFHWIYNFIKMPSPLTIEFLQKILIIFSFLGLGGLFPKKSALIIFIGYLHIIGFVQATDNEVDGGTLCLISLLILAISPNTSFYHLLKKNKISTSTNHRWPIYLLFLFVGSFYTSAGLNKVMNAGPHWPFMLHLDNFATLMKESSVFVASSMSYSPFFIFMDYYWFSVFSGIVTLIGEIGFISILFFPRGRLFFISTMIFMHVAVFYTHTINFLGSSVILLLCFDWNALFRKSIVYYDGECDFCTKSVNAIKRWDFFRRVTFQPIQNLQEGQHGFSLDRLKREIGALEENGDIYYGEVAFEKVFEKVPLFYPLALLYKVPFTIYLAKYFYATIAKNRHLIKL